MDLQTKLSGKNQNGKCKVCAFRIGIPCFKELQGSSLGFHATDSNGSTIWDTDLLPEDAGSSLTKMITFFRMGNPHIKHLKNCDDWHFGGVRGVDQRYMSQQYAT